jgi:CHAT domain-containing protein
LSRSENFVHVAAHGTTDSGYLGRSGLWLDCADRGGLPQFLSVLDLFDRGVRSQLVVLSACDMGGGQARRANTLVFADTLARLGARNVVAALWPVSDNAAKSWGPLFYAALDARPGLDVGSALRQSQLQLLRVGHFRHPYYWASLIHVQRLGVASDHD